MRIDIISVLPKLLESPLSESMVKRAQDKGFVEIIVHNLRDYSTDKHGNVDDYQYGGGAGMVIQIEPVARLMDQLKSERNYDEIIYMTPDGETLGQQTANHLSTLENILVLCGHYKGIDERIRVQYITKEISIGDYVLSGGELPAAVLCDCIIRLLPGVLSDETSALSDSFQDKLLAPPVYTRPDEYDGLKVPEILLSGNEKAIQEWRQEQSLKRTKERRPDLMDGEE